MYCLEILLRFLAQASKIICLGVSFEISVSKFPLRFFLMLPRSSVFRLSAEILSRDFFRDFCSQVVLFQNLMYRSCLLRSFDLDFLLRLLVSGFRDLMFLTFSESSVSGFRDVSRVCLLKPLVSGFQDLLSRVFWCPVLFLFESFLPGTIS